METTCTRRQQLCANTDASRLTRSASAQRVRPRKSFRASPRPRDNAPARQRARVYTGTHHTCAEHANRRASAEQVHTTARKR
eukprot:3507222-Pleurochrysis_carterae.AAC.1